MLVSGKPSQKVSPCDLISSGFYRPPHGGPRKISLSKAGVLGNLVRLKFVVTAVATRQTWKRALEDAEVQKEPIYDILEWFGCILISLVEY
jgi:hypothetical protein